MFRIYAVMLACLMILLTQGCASLFDRSFKPMFPDLPDKLVLAPDKNSDLKITSTLLDILDDPSATALVDEAVKNNYSLKATALRLRSSGLLLSRTNADRLPKVDAGYNASRNKFADDLNSLSSHKVSLSVSWELDLWGKLADRHMAQEKKYQSEKFDYGRALDSLAARVLQGYFNVKANKLKLDIQKERVKIYQSIETTIINKYQAGLGTLDDISTAKTKTGVAQSGVATAMDEHASAVRDLEVLLGRYPGTKLDFTGDLPNIGFSAPAAPAAILANRPDVQAALSRYDAANFSSIASQKDMLPGITLSAEMFKQTPQFTSLDSTGSSRWIVGNLLYPLFNAGKLKNEAEAAGIEADAAAMDVAYTIITAMKEAENVFAKSKYLKMRLFHLENAVKHAKQSSLYYETCYKKGLADIIALHTAREQELNLMSDIIDVKASRIFNRVDMALTLGVTIF
ncbi:TolC family protein [Desulfobacula toluolica]|uniref:Predicted outer membrane efflux pump protein n=1 Tax=Desulfobacula toluolica (strain DSM 7467 / Tol2) TaxID=651182 RepID=K0NHY5_DESTT|nr:TolC family protein [Desulfobacula toluolica]CCK78572.1 predicted outer membrane efflux pump protein [Desulfobacula toluolica Tol2]